MNNKTIVLFEKDSIFLKETSLYFSYTFVNLGSKFAFKAFPTVN